MWKTNKGVILATALVILLPMLIGVVLWDRLPQSIALGVKLNMGTVCSLLLGLLFLVLGNLLPKVKQNYTFGIKLPWTLYDPENWSRTHRFGGWCMVLAGIVLLAAAPWPTPWVMLPAILAAALAPMVYSYVFYRRHRKEES